MTSEPDLSGIPVDPSMPVLVTGATGYVAGWIVKGLLAAGVTVHAAVRDPSRTDRVAHLQAMAEGAPGTLRLFAADLLKDGSYTEAMAGCGIVMHTASPFTVDVKDPQRELIDPAVQGTRTVLESANTTPSVTRVVLTSSCAAIYTDAEDCAKAPGGRLTEDVWNTTASLEYQPYSYSKLLAEREAWAIADAQDRWRLVVINPSLVVGPATNPEPTSESFAIVGRFADGSMRFGAPRVGMGVVDVREVARAHIAAAYLPDAQGRHILSGHDTDLLELGRALAPRFGDRYPLPKRPAPKPLISLVAPLIGLERRFVAGNVDHPWRADNTKSRTALGIEYRPLGDSMQDMFGQMIETGMVKRRG